MEKKENISLALENTRISLYNKSIIKLPPPKKSKFLL